MLYVGPLAALADQLAGVPQNHDDRPIFEFLAGRTRFPQRDRFLTEGFAALANRVLGADSGVGISGPRLELAGAGALFARACRLAADGQNDALRTTLAELRSRVPAALLTTPDPTVAEVWP